MKSINRNRGWWSISIPTSFNILLKMYLLFIQNTTVNHIYSSILGVLFAKIWIPMGDFK